MLLSVRLSKHMNSVGSFPDFYHFCNKQNLKLKFFTAECEQRTYICENISFLFGPLPVKNNTVYSVFTSSTC